MDLTETSWHILCLVPDSIPRMFPLGCFRDTSDVSEIPRILPRYLRCFRDNLGCFRDTLDVSEVPWMRPQFSETAHVSSRLLSHLDWSENRASQVVHPYVLYWNFLYLDKIDVKFHLDEFFWSCYSYKKKSINVFCSVHIYFTMIFNIIIMN